MKNLLITIALSLGVILSGCAILEENPSTAKLTIQVAVLKIIDGDSDRADRVVEIAQKARFHVSSDSSVTIEAIDGEIRRHIRWDTLGAAEKLLVNAILDEAKQRLQDEIGAGLLDADQKVKVITVLDWIEQAAGMS